MKKRTVFFTTNTMNREIIINPEKWSRKPINNVMWNNDQTLAEVLDEVIEVFSEPFNYEMNTNQESFMCNALKSRHKHAVNLAEILPEFLAYKPEHCMSVWFPKEDKEMRVEILRHLRSRVYETDLTNRLTTYKKMLEDFSRTTPEDRKKNGAHGGFCWWLQHQYGEGSMEINDYDELMEFKPLEHEMFSSIFWFDYGRSFDQVPRADLLRKAISSVKEKIGIAASEWAL